jgi:phosphoesterase RecJ-like protein
MPVFSYRALCKPEAYPGMVFDVGALLGYAKAGFWRDRAAYACTAEVGVYVNHAAHRRGIGRALYVALLTDTGGFRFSNTRPHTLRIAADLLEIGVDPEQIYLEVYARAPEGRPRLFAEALQTLVVEPEYGLAWVTVPPGSIERHGVSSDDLDGVVEFPRSIEGVRMALLFREIAQGRVMVSLRSVGDVDVAAFAKAYGGGGHTKAAGLSLTGSLAEVQDTVLRAAREYLGTNGVGGR